MNTVFKTEITYEAARPFKYTTDLKYNRGDPVEFEGLPNDDRLLTSGLVQPRITYFCRQRYCNKSFRTITELLQHERDTELHRPKEKE